MSRLLTIVAALAAAAGSFAQQCESPKVDQCAAKGNAVAERPRSRTAAARLPVVAIPDCLQTNGVVSAMRGMTEALLKAGLLPVVMPEMDDAAADQLLSCCDAVMIAGGIKGQDYARRCAFEDRVIDLAMKRKMPIVGVCHGSQVINRHFGGTLAPVPSDGKIVHKDQTAFMRTGKRAEHMATVLPGKSLMSDVFGEGELKINSSHRMRSLEIAPGFRVTAKAADGVIEAFEHEKLPIFAFQFHPEYYWTTDARFLELISRAFSAARK